MKYKNVILGKKSCCPKCHGLTTERIIVRGVVYDMTCMECQRERLVIIDARTKKGKK